MRKLLNKNLDELKKEDIVKIKLVCFDCDGVTVEKGTEIIKETEREIIVTKQISSGLVEKIKELSKYFQISFSSGRSMLYLKKMYGRVLGKGVSLQSEIGLFSLVKGELKQNFVLSDYELGVIKKIRDDLEKLENEKIKGFEPKLFLITLHSWGVIEEVEQIVRKYDYKNEFYCWWNEEAYDIAPKRINKGSALKKLGERLGIKVEEMMTVGNGINDKNMIEQVGVGVSTDGLHLEADFVVEGEHLGGEMVVDKLLELVEGA
ncbi:hypothetical protein DRH14_05045 [Candidatus Shapirobacteria bacterium]|nr:MAG: hypothetical protein DRH14_05045 [Candidatus Shapirobacteria bacterium]